MTHPKNAITRTLESAALVLVALPLLALLALGLRFLVPVVIALGVVAWVVSPAFRGWFMVKVEDAPPR